MSLKLIFAVVMLFLIKVLFEYISVRASFNKNNELAKEEDKIPLKKVMLNWQRLGFFLEACFGSILLSLNLWLMQLVVPFSSLLFLPIYFVVLLITILINNILYSTISNLWFASKKEEIKQGIMNEATENNKYSDSPDAPSDLKDYLKKRGKY